MPDVGERKTVNGVTGEWDGTTWRKVAAAPAAEPSFSGAEDFTGRMTRYAKPLVGTMVSDLAAPFLHPIDTATNLVSRGAQTVRGLGEAARQQLDAASGRVTGPQPAPDLGILSDMYATGKAALQGDPNAAGHLLAIPAAPRVYGGMLRGTNAAADALATSKTARSAAGYVGGAAASIATGAGHPFMGGVIGRMASPLLESPAREVAGGTGWLMDKLGMNEGAGSVATPLTTAEGGMAEAAKADLARQGWSPEKIANVDELMRAKASGSGPGRGGSSPPPAPAAPRTPPPSRGASAGTGASTPPLSEVRATLPPDLRMAEEATGTRDALSPPSGSVLDTADATHEALMQKLGGGLPDFEVVGDEGSAGPQTNASGESAASGEALSRQASMKGQGQQFMVYDRAGNARPLVGPDAVDYTPRPGETYGVQDPQGFRTLTDNGGRVPPSNPSAQSQTVRLYRGESDAARPGPDAGRNFTDDPLAAAYYAKQGGGAGQTYYLDLPADQAASFRTADPTGQGVHVLPPELAAQARGNVLGAGTSPGASIIKPAPAGEPPGPILQQQSSILQPSSSPSSQPLGLPRVKAWKSGAGPSTETAATYRGQFGSRDAAARLKTTPAQIKALTPDMLTQLPARARAAIDAQLSQLSGPDLEAYLQSAPHPLARDYILQKLGRVE